MKIIDIKDTLSYEIASKESALTLFKDGAVVYPTDTLYGLGVNALDERALRYLFSIKQRPETKPIPLMVSSIEMAKALAFIDKSREQILNSFWPGPFTFVLWKRRIVPVLVSAGRDTVALRIPAHPFCQSFLRDFEGPITATSANVSGEEALLDPQVIVARFAGEEHQPDLVVDAGVLPESYPSTVVDLTADTPKVLRINPTTKDKLLKILKVVQINEG